MCCCLLCNNLNQHMQKDKFQKNKGDNNRPNMVNYNLHTPSM